VAAGAVINPGDVQIDSSDVQADSGIHPNDVQPLSAEASPDNRSLLDHLANDPNTIPLDSYWHATLHGLANVGQGVAQGVQGAVGLVKSFGSAEGPVGAIGKQVVDTAKQAAQVPSAIKDINASPDPVGTYLRAASDTAGQAGGQAALAVATEGAIKGAGEIAKQIPTEARVAEGIKATVPEARSLPNNAVAAGDKVFRAVAPVATDAAARTNIHVASGDLAEISKKVDWDSTRGGVARPDMRPRAVLNATNDYMKEMYQNERAAQIADKPQSPVQAPLAGNSAKGLDFIAQHAGDDAVQELAGRVVKQGGKMTLAEADGLARTVNAELYKFESLPPDQQAMLRATQPNVNGLKALDQVLSKTVDEELAAQGKPGIKQYERRYAALSNFRRDLAKRVNAAELDQPGVLKNTVKAARTAVMGSPAHIASASAAAVADVRVGDMLEQGMKGLEKSKVKPILDRPRLPAPRVSISNQPFQLSSPGQMPSAAQRPLSFMDSPNPTQSGPVYPGGSGLKKGLK
jgi:hypothetical protein